MKAISPTPLQECASINASQGTPHINNSGFAQTPMPSLKAFFDGFPVPAFAINADHLVTVWNKACERLTGFSAKEMLGTSEHWKPFYSEKRPMLTDLIVNGEPVQSAKDCHGDSVRRSSAIENCYETEEFFPGRGEGGQWLFFSAASLQDEQGGLVGAIGIMRDITQQKSVEPELRKVQRDLEEMVEKRTAQLAQANDRLEHDIRRRESAEAELLRRNAELTELNEKLSMARDQLIQSEKLASIGQLAAGVAHEINNPIGYIFSNFGALETYIARMLEILSIYEKAEPFINSPETAAELKLARERVELDYLKEDIPVLLSESREGIVRVRKIVQDLKDFSRVDAHQEWQWADLHRGIDSTLNIVSNEIKYKADVIKEYGDIPEVECLPSQINQVVMNITVNAAHAINGERGRITIRTGTEGQNVWMEISDTGAGIPNEILPRIFDPFFTTKPVGSGTGLGLSLSYGIIQKHHGRIEVKSELGRGTSFRITLPIHHREEGEEKKAKP